MIWVHHFRCDRFLELIKVLSSGTYFHFDLWSHSALLPLVLPPSSEDLLITPDVLLKACSTYEVLRHYRMLLRLSPFRFEDFCASLAAEEQSNLLSEIHIALLKTIMRAEEKDNTTFAPMDQKDSVNCMFFFLDSLTWPEGLKSYLSSDPDLYAEPLQVLQSKI